VTGAFEKNRDPRLLTMSPSLGQLVLIEIPLELNPEDKTRLASSNIEKLIRVACACLSNTTDPKSIEQVSTTGMHYFHVREYAS